MTRGMNKSWLLTATVLLWPLSGHVQPGPTKDREQIIDVAALTEAMQQATEPVTQRMRTSRRKQRFAHVKEVLDQKQVDKEQLLTALYDLADEMNTFMADWAQVTSPLWEAQDTIGKTIDKVRSMMAGSDGGDHHVFAHPVVVHLRLL